MGNAKKTAIHISKFRACQYLFSFVFNLKISVICGKFLIKKELCFGNKTEMLKIWKLNMKKEESNKNVQLPFSPTKSYYMNVFLRICINLSEQNCLDKPVFNYVSRLNHLSPMNNTVTNKIKHFPQLFPLGPQTASKQSWKYASVLWSIITTALYMFISIKMIIFARVICKFSAWSQ